MLTREVLNTDNDEDPAPSGDILDTFIVNKVIPSRYREKCTDYATEKWRLPFGI
jgi:hypothetical protein